MIVKILFLFFGCTLSFSSIAATTTIQCTYDRYSSPDGFHHLDEDFELSFVIDPENKKSYVLGNNGSNEVIKVSGGDHFSFLEMTGANNIMSTTITSSMESVHSRNTVGFGGALIPSQYYGECVVK